MDLIDIANVRVVRGTERKRGCVQWIDIVLHTNKWLSMPLRPFRRRTFLKAVTSRAGFARLRISVFRFNHRYGNNITLNIIIVLKRENIFMKDDISTNENRLINEIIQLISLECSSITYHYSLDSSFLEFILMGAHSSEETKTLKFSKVRVMW